MKKSILSLLLTLLASQYVMAKDNKEATDNKAPKNTSKIHITGANKDLQENINAMLPSRKPDCDASIEVVDNFKQSANRYLEKAAKGLGYYDSRYNIKPHKSANCWVFDINVNAGAVTRVGDVTVQVTGDGKQEKVFQDILAKPMYQKGEQLKQDKYSSYKTSLANAASAKGYFDAEFTEHQIAINPQSHRADIVLKMETGKRYRYGKITMHQDILDPAYVQRFVQIKEGELYDSNTLSEQQIYLQTTNYYSDVIIHSEKDKVVDHNVPIDIELTPRKRTEYEFKLGYGTDTGIRTSAKMQRHWTGRTGHRLQHEFKLSERASSVESRYTIPKQHPQTENLFYNIKFSKEKTEDITSTEAEIGAQYTKKNGGGFQQTAFIKYLTENTEIEDEPTFDSNYLLFGVRAERTKRNHTLYPTKGQRLSLDIQAAHDSLFSSQNVLKVELNSKFLYPIGKGKIVTQLNAGTVISQDFDRLPQSLRYFAGGRDSVRGYAYQSLGERNSNGKNIGGKNLLTTSLEYDHPLSDSFTAAAFVDAGNAFHEWDSSSTLKVGSGVGLRWKSPVGPVSVDVAWPKDNLNDPHLHLSIGPEL